MLATGADTFLTINCTFEFTHIRVWVYSPKEDGFVLTMRVSTLELWFHASLADLVHTSIRKEQGRVFIWDG